MGAWILSISGVICLGILLEIVLPEGKTAKYIKGAFSLLVVLAIVAPLPSLLKKDFDISVKTDAFTVSRQDDYVDAYKASFEDAVKGALAERGCESQVKITTVDGVVKRVDVTVYDMILRGEEIVDVAAKTLAISPLKVNVLYEFYK